MNGIPDWLWFIVSVIPAVGFIAGALIAGTQRSTRRKIEDRAMHFERIIRGEPGWEANEMTVPPGAEHLFAEPKCTSPDRHGVPWPVMSVDGVWVGWLCGQCLEPRDTFKPKPKPPPCEHEWDEHTDWNSLILRRICCRCGQVSLVTKETEDWIPEFRTLDGGNPFDPYRFTDPRR